MVIGLLTIASIPTVTGVAFGVSEQRKSNERREEARRMVKFNIEARTDGDTDDDREIQGMVVVVRNEKVYLDHKNPSKRTRSSFTALSFYVEYPELDETKHLKRGLGLPTHVSDNPPLLNWVYVDEETHELKYGNRSQSVTHLVGPWDWTDDEKVITLEEKRRFVAVEEEDEGEGVWALYFDRDGDELAAVLEEQGRLDSAFVPVELVRKVFVEEKPPQQKQS